MFKLKTRIALIYCAFLGLTIIVFYIFFNIALKSNLNNISLIKEIYPSGVYFSVYEVPSNISTFNNKIVFNPNILEKTDVNTMQFDKLLKDELFNRSILVSLSTLIIILTIGFYFSRYLSTLALKPLNHVTQAIKNISSDNLNTDLDLTKLNADDKIVKLANSYNETLKKLNRTFSDLERFNSYASHELRNSLAILKAKIEIGVKNEELNKYVDNVEETVNDMLILSSRQMKNKREPVDLALITAKAVDEYSLTRKQIKLSIPEEGVSTVLGNETWLSRCVCNLLDNAIKYSYKDSPILVSIIEQDNAIILSVKDYGIGIPASEQEDIWKPYYSIDSNNNVHGIGLALINNVVDLSGGMVWVDSYEGKESTFYISLPISLS
ncbi:hypothetical protein AN1V17_07360 [Vallitalea sediminicola]